MSTPLVIMTVWHTFCLDCNILPGESGRMPGSFLSAIFLNDWKQMKLASFRITACSCSYSARVIYRVLNRSCLVALIFTTLVIAELQDSSISKKHVAPSITRLDTTKFLSLGYMKESAQRNKLYTTAALKVPTLRTVFCNERQTKSNIQSRYV